MKGEKETKIFDTKTKAIKQHSFFLVNEKKMAYLSKRNYLFVYTVRAECHLCVCEGLSYVFS